MCVYFYLFRSRAANFVLSNVEGYPGQSHKKNIRYFGMWVIYSIGMEFFTMFLSLGKYSLVIHKKNPRLVWEIPLPKKWYDVICIIACTYII